MTEKRYQGYPWMRAGITLFLFAAILTTLSLPLVFIALWRTMGAVPAVQYTLLGAVVVFFLLLVSEVLRLLLDLEARTRPRTGTASDEGPREREG